MEQYKIFLDESEMPRQWYNLNADLPNPPQPPLGRTENPSHRTCSRRFFR